MKKKKKHAPLQGSVRWYMREISVAMFFLIQIYIYIYIYNSHGLPCQEKVSRFSALPIPCNLTSLAVSHWKLRMLQVLIVGYRSSCLNQNKPFSGPVSTLLSSSAEFYSFNLSGRLRDLLD